MADDGFDGDSLVRRAKSDRDAFGELFDRHHPRIYRYALRRVFHREAAEDVVSEVFLRVAEHLPRFGGTTESDFLRWIYRIASNAAAERLRSAQRRDRLLRAAALAGDLGPAEISERPSDDPYEIARALAQLDERSQTAVALRYMESMSYDDVAAVLKVRPGTARVVVSRAIERLRGLLSSCRSACTGGPK